ncbi:MAG: hypothetical protein ACREU3_07745 [Steroidobacteraceae bacterium]
MRFTGRVECRRSSARISLDGHGPGGERVLVALVGAAPADLPATLDCASIESLADGRYRVSSGGREWTLGAAREIVHLDAAAAFYAAVPPRKVPLRKRMLWRFALAAAATRPGRWWLARAAR